MVSYDTLNPFLDAHGVDHKRTYLAFHSWPKKRSLEDVWLRDRALFEKWQALQSEECFPDPKMEWLASFVRLRDDPGHGLFLWVYRLRGWKDLAESGESVYDELLQKTYTKGWWYFLEPLDPEARISRLSRCVTVNGVTRYWHPRAASRDREITQLLDEPYDPPFPGVLMFDVNVDELPNLPRPWKDELVRERGVYVLTIDDMWYVGKADGEGGFLERWEEYRLTRHGGNKRVKAYTDAHSQAKIVAEAVWKMEAYSTSVDVLAMEAFWKKRMERWRPKKGLNGN